MDRHWGGTIAYRLSGQKVARVRGNALPELVLNKLALEDGANDNNIVFSQMPNNAIAFRLQSLRPADW